MEILCKRCQQSKDAETNFHKNNRRSLGFVTVCKECSLKDQQKLRENNNNINTKKYEKTYMGFLVRTYRNMESRVTGIQIKKAHLYEGLKLLNRESFYDFSLKDPTFYSLFETWKAANYPNRLTPSIERKDPTKGYELENIEWITHSENSKRGSLSRWRLNK